MTDNEITRIANDALGRRSSVGDYKPGVFVIARAVAAQVERERDELKRERDEAQRALDAQQAAIQRGVQRWRAAHPGREIVLPDTATLVEWMCERLDGACTEHTHTLSKLREAYSALRRIDDTVRDAVRRVLGDDA